jgi:hypothetical protein
MVAVEVRAGSYFMNLSACILDPAWAEPVAPNAVGVEFFDVRPDRFNSPGKSGGPIFICRPQRLILPTDLILRFFGN